MSVTTLRGFAIVVAVALVLGVAEPDVLRAGSLAASATILGVAGLGTALFVAVAGQPSLGHGAFMGFGAYSTALSTVRWGWDPLAGIVLGVAVSLLVAVALGSGVLRLRPYYLAMATLALALGLQAGLVGASGFTGGSGGLPGIPPLEVFGFTISGNAGMIMASLVPLVLGTVMLYRVYHASAGMALRASHLDPVAAEALGIDVFRLRFWALLVSVVLVSISGSLLAHQVNFVSPGQFGIVRSIELLIIVALAGRAPLTGALAGAFAWGLVEELAAPVPNARLLVTGLLLYVVIMRTSDASNGAAGFNRTQVSALFARRDAPTSEADATSALMDSPRAKSTETSVRRSQ